MTHNQRSVRDWMLKFGQNCPEKPVQLDEKTTKLRAKLILEECLETLCDGLGVRVHFPDSDVDSNNLDNFVKNLTFYKIFDTDLESLADGISDSMVVNEGTAVAAGIDTEEIHNEVCRSNDSKMWTRNEIEQCDGDIDYKKVSSEEERCFLVRDKDGKVVKSPSYSEANILPILEKQIKG